MRWFWSRSRRGAAPAAADGIPATVVEEPTTRAWDENEPVRRPHGSAPAPQAGEGDVGFLVADATDGPPPDLRVLPVVATACTAAVRGVLRDDPAAVEAALSVLASGLGVAVPEEASLAYLAPLAVLADRLSDAAGREADGTAPLGRLVPQAERLAAATVALLPRFGPALSVDLLRFCAHFACGAPDHDPTLTAMMATGELVLVRTTCLLLAQSIAEQGEGTDQLEGDLLAVFGPG